MNFYAVAISLLVACQVKAEEVARPVSDADRIVAVYTESRGRRTADQPRLVLAVWKDGYIVWSEDRLSGGAPYRAGQIDAKRLESVLSDLGRDGIFGEEGLSHNHFGPDAAFTTILIHDGARRIAMRSWHELYESNGRVVASADGLMALERRSLFTVLKGQPADYLFFRYVWSEVRARTAGLVPFVSRPVSGELVMEHRVVSWHETPAPNEQRNAAKQGGGTAELGTDQGQPSKRDGKVKVSKKAAEAIAIKEVMARTKLKGQQVEVLDDSKLEGEVWRVVVHKVPSRVGGFWFVYVAQDGTIRDFEGGE